jgi:hypothetical protein
MLKNIETKEIVDKICNCHTCFVKLPLVTVVIVLSSLYFL